MAQDLKTIREAAEQLDRDEMICSLVSMEVRVQKMSAQEEIIAQIAKTVGLPGSGATPNVLTMVKCGQEAVDCLSILLGWEWTVDQGWNEKVSESTKIEKNETFEDLRREEIAQLEAENHRLRDEFQKTLKTSARLEEVGKLREENKKLKEKVEREYDGRCADNDQNEQREKDLIAQNKGLTILKQEAEQRSFCYEAEIKKLKDFTHWENHPALKHKVVLDDDFYLQHLDEESQLIDPEQLKKLQETVAEQATDLFFMKCECLAGGDHIRDTIGCGAEWAEEVKDAMRRLFHNCPVNDVELDEMFKRYLEWANIYLSDVESDDEE